MARAKQKVGVTAGTSDTGPAGGGAKAINEIEESSPDKVVAAIYRGIMGGRYAPGQKLIEADLSAALRLSRAPIREALKRLAAEGVIELTRHRGGYVKVMSRVEAQDFLELVDALTAVIVRRAAEAAKDSEKAKDVAEAFRYVKEYQSAQYSQEAWLEQRGHFYETLIKVGGNSQIESVLPTIRIHLLRLQVEPFLTKKDRVDRLKEYEAVTKAVLAGDTVRARREMRKHVQRMIMRISRLPDEAFSLHITR